MLPFGGGESEFAVVPSYTHQRTDFKLALLFGYASAKIQRSLLQYESFNFVEQFFRRLML